MATAIRHAKKNVGITAHTCNSAVDAHTAVIDNAIAITTHVRFAGVPSLSPGVHMIDTHAPSILSQAGHNHVATIKRKALGRVSTTISSGLPNAIFHNPGYDEA